MPRPTPALAPPAMRDDFRLVVRDVWARTRARTTVSLALLVGAVMLEGLSLALVFPILGEVGLSYGDGGNPVANATDGVLDRIGIPATLGWLVVVVLVASAVRWLLLLGHGGIAATTRFDYVRQHRLETFGSVLGARWQLFWASRTGDVTNLLVQECERLGGLYTQLVTMVGAILTVVVYSVVAFAASWTASVLVVACGLALVVVTRPVERRTYAGGAEITARHGELTSITEEVLNGIKFVKATATEPTARERLAPIASRTADVQARNLRLLSWLTVSFDVSSVALLLLVVVVGTRVLDVPAATMLVIAGIFGRLYPRLAAVQQASQAIVAYLPALRAVIDLRRRAEDMAEEADVRPLPDDLVAPVGISIDGLTVRYGDVTALRAVSLDIEPGSITAVVGSSGSGKSTLANALLRLVEADEGRILAGCHDVAELSLPTWRRAVGYVSQETVLFHTSIRENLTWGRPGTTDDDLERVAALAGVLDLVRSLPNGFGAVVGDRGALLSGGQRQRIGLARALLGDPVLLVLDEATSSLDAEAERSVLDAVGRLRGRVTVVTIAHRLATVRDADRIHVVEAGEVVETGTWDDLVTSGGRFAELWRLQSGAPA